MHTPIHRLPALLLASVALTAAQSSPVQGNFDVITFNVAGLPDILNDNGSGDKDANTARIGQLFTQYNISLIHVQEDFNYHATLYANDKHPFRTPTSGGVPFGSGLNTLSNFNWTDFERVKWETCSNFDSADCLTPKGFTFMRVKISEGVWIDAYNLHADAGVTSADLEARAANLRQLSDHITTYSVGNPVLVFGDSNTRYTRADDNPGIFSSTHSMTDAWIELVKDGVVPTPGSEALLCDNPSPNTTCETVDKVWYRGSPAVDLQATRFDYVGDMFLQDNGDTLSDHNPVLVDFTWSKSNSWSIGDAFGGEFGTWFNDLDALSQLQDATVSSITLRGQERLDAVELTLASGQTLSHGGTGGTAQTLTLSTGEKLSKSTLCKGEKDGKARVFYAQFTTTQGNSISAGTKTNDCVDISNQEGRGIVGFFGRSGDEIDKLGFIYGSI